MPSLLWDKETGKAYSSLPQRDTRRVFNSGKQGDSGIISLSPSSSLIICFNSPQSIMKSLSSFGRLWARDVVKININLWREYNSRLIRLWRLTCLVGPFHIYLSLGNLFRCNSFKDDSVRLGLCSLVVLAGVYGVWGTK